MHLLIGSNSALDMDCFGESDLKTRQDFMQEYFLKEFNMGIASGSNRFTRKMVVIK